MRFEHVAPTKQPTMPSPTAAPTQSFQVRQWSVSRDEWRPRPRRRSPRELGSTVHRRRRLGAIRAQHLRRSLGIVYSRGLFASPRRNVRCALRRLERHRGVRRERRGASGAARATPTHGARRLRRCRRGRRVR
jgi:hypothetical protein